MNPGDKNILFKKWFKIISPYLNLVGTLLVTLPGTSLIDSATAKILMVISGALVLFLYILYVKNYGEIIEKIKTGHGAELEKVRTGHEAELEKIKTEHRDKLRSVKIASISDFTKEINYLTEHLSLEWDVTKADLYQDNIVNTVSSTLSNLDVKDVRVLLYGISAEENDDNYHLLFKKCSKNARPPNQKNFTVNKNDPYKLFDVLKNKVPSQITRPINDLESNLSYTQVKTHSRHWKHSLRFPLDDGRTPINPSDAPEQYLFIVDTSEDTELPDFIHDILRLAAHLLSAALKQAGSLGEANITPHEIPTPHIKAK